MDERLIAMATSMKLCDLGFNDPDGPCSHNWATGWKVKTAIELLPLLYEQSRNRKASRSSYGLKHEVENLFQKYAPELSDLHTGWVGNGELILAMAYCGFHDYHRSGLNAYYHLRDRRKGALNKKGKAKEEAMEMEKKIEALLLQKVADHLEDQRKLAEETGDVRREDELMDAQEENDRKMLWNAIRQNLAEHSRPIHTNGNDEPKDA